jgi:hypothetical protein
MLLIAFVKTRGSTHRKSISAAKFRSSSCACENSRVPGFTLKPKAHSVMMPKVHAQIS